MVERDSKWDGSGRNFMQLRFTWFCTGKVSLIQLKTSLLMDSSSEESITMYLHNWNNLKGESQVKLLSTSNLAHHVLLPFRQISDTEMNVISIKDEGWNMSLWDSAPQFRYSWNKLTSITSKRNHTPVCFQLCVLFLDIAYCDGGCSCCL